MKTLIIVIWFCLATAFININANAETWWNRNARIAREAADMAIKNPVSPETFRKIEKRLEERGIRLDGTWNATPSGYEKWLKGERNRSIILTWDGKIMILERGVSYKHIDYWKN